MPNRLSRVFDVVWFLAALVLPFAATGLATPASRRPRPRVPQVVLIDMVNDSTGRHFRPAEVTVQHGDTLRFVLRAGTHNVDFLADSNASGVVLPPKTRLTDLPGDTLNVVVTMPPGRYYYQCDPHLAMKMVGHVRVASPAAR